jgi:replicative DNA helicase
MFIYREAYYNKQTDRENITDILIKKHRNGPVGDVELYFHPEQRRFTNLDRFHAPKPLPLAFP